MKPNHGIHKVLSMLLFCVMLLGLLPTTALAANITQVDITIDAPQAGQVLDFSPEGSTDQYNVGVGSSNVSWYDETRGEAAYNGDYAKAGRTYRVKIRIIAKDSNRFHTSTTRGSINGISASVTGDTGVIYLETYFSVPSQITSVELEIDAPAPGNTPDFRPSCGNTTYGLSAYFDDDDPYNYTENGVQWIDATTKKVMDADDTFVAGHTYQVFIHLTRYGNTEFYYDFGKTPPVTAEIRTGSGTYTARTAKAYERDPLYEIDVICDFGECQYQKITSVAIGMVDAPEEGASPDYDANITSQKFSLKPTSAGNPFVVNGVNWYDETTGTDLTATARFIAGHTYTVTVYLVPADGYRFDNSVTGTIDRTTALITGSGSEIQVKYTFPALATNQITNVAIESITPPALGKSPSYVAIVKGQGYGLKARNDAYYKNGICWSVMEGSDLLVSGGAFEGGKKYQITMSLVAQAGYEFAASASGALNVRATVNGKAAAEVIGNKNEIVVIYYFTEATADTKITSAAVTGIDAPVIGASPDYTADIVDSRYTLKSGNSAREKNGITWINNKTGNAMTVGASKFEEGVSYSVVVGVTAADGYAFAVNAAGGLQISGTINGNPAVVSGQDKYNAYLTYTFGALLPNTISSISVTGVDTSAGDPTKTNAAKLAVSDQNVGVKSLSWETTTTEDSKDYTATLVLQTKNGYKFGDPVKATVNGSYAEVLSITGSEVTLRWTTSAKTTVEKPTDEKPAVTVAFDDVAKGVYYEEPVAWAVDQKVTTGMTKSSFGPDVTCSQAHILTFLWRAVGEPKATIASPYSNAAVKEGQYFYVAFVWAWEKGLIGNTAHDPDAPCSRSDVVTYLWKLEGSPKVGAADFADVPASAPYAQAVAWAVQNGVTNGTGANTFSPDAICTRAQIVTFLWRYMNI